MFTLALFQTFRYLLNKIWLNRKTVQCNVLSQVQAADSVLVIGGGATGVEMAAEIRTEYPDKKVLILVTQRHLSIYSMTNVIIIYLYNI